jgi:hypothetical protein
VENPNLSLSLSLSLSLHLCGEWDKLLNLVFFKRDSRERATNLLVGRLMDAFGGEEEKLSNNTLCKRKIGSVREGEEEETREGVWLFRYANASKQARYVGLPHSFASCTKCLFTPNQAPYNHRSVPC